MDSLASDLLTDTDRCVMCGLCLPHCPTYTLSQNEAQSPRGRISLIQALARGQLAAEPALIRHLDSCLNCRACETMCPSKVSYGRIIDKGQRLVHAQKSVRTPLVQRLARSVLTSKSSGIKLLQAGLRFYQLSGLQGLLRRSRVLGKGKLAAADGLLPKLQKLTAYPEYIAPSGTERGRVALFVGCTGPSMDSATIESTIKLLGACGYGIHIPRTQGCCGALHHHAGEAERFEGYAKINLQAFAELEAKVEIEAIVFIATGCGTMLKEYGQWLEGASAISTQAVEICDFLDRVEWPLQLEVAALPEKVLVHEPCSQRFATDNHASSPLLQRIPDIRLEALADNKSCCGAGGDVMLTNPAMANSLRQPKLDALAANGAATLVSTNIGCALHLAAGIREAGLKVEVIHPVTLLARLL